MNLLTRVHVILILKQTLVPLLTCFCLNKIIGCLKKCFFSVSVTAEPLHKMAPAKLYNELLPLKLSLEQLTVNGYPFWDQTLNQAVFAPTLTNQRDWVVANG